MHKLILIIFTLIAFCSCNTTKKNTSLLKSTSNTFANSYRYFENKYYLLFKINPCSNCKSTDKHFRVSVKYSGTDKILTESKAISIAKKELSNEIDNYIVEKWGHSLFLLNSDYEHLIDSSKKILLDNVIITCSKNIMNNDNNYSYISIELDKKNVDIEIERKFNLNLK